MTLFHSLNAEERLEVDDPGSFEEDSQARTGRLPIPDRKKTVAGRSESSLASARVKLTRLERPDRSEAEPLKVPRQVGTYDFKIGKIPFSFFSVFRGNRKKNFFGAPPRGKASVI